MRKERELSDLWFRGWDKNTEIKEININNYKMPGFVSQKIKRLDQSFFFVCCILAHQFSILLDFIFLARVLEFIVEELVS